MSQQQSPAARPQFLEAAAFQFEYREKCSPRTSGLQWLTYGVYRAPPGAASSELFHRTDEALLFALSGRVVVDVAGQPFQLDPYDTLYVPLAAPYRLENRSEHEASLVVCRAAAERRHEPVHSVWERVRQDASRIRRLDRKLVYIMLDVSDAADKLVAGYTVYEPFTRAWPPHNHSDQEEIYIFIEGAGAIEVYAEERTKTFVRSVGPMDAATIPVLNYHPVFSQEQPLRFIWCLAGARYWVGDRRPEMMDGSVDRLTS